MLALPTQIVDNFLLNYNVGQAILLVFILGTLGALTQKSQKVLGLNWIAFGLLFLLTPGSLQPIHYKFLGIVLLFVGPMLLVTARD